MQLARPVFAPDPRLFGRGRAREVAPGPAPALPARKDGRRAQHRFDGRISGELKLFATTFLAGFVFVTVLIA
jgi:hypothetical protein